MGSSISESLTDAARRSRAHPDASFDAPRQYDTQPSQNTGERSPFARSAAGARRCYFLHLPYPWSLPRIFLLGRLVFLSFFGGGAGGAQDKAVMFSPECVSHPSIVSHHPHHASTTTERKFPVWASIAGGAGKCERCWGGGCGQAGGTGTVDGGGVGGFSSL